MNCETVVENIKALAEGELHGEEKTACMKHVAVCQDCADALRGVRAMLVVRDQAAVPGSERVFNRVMSRAGYDPHGGGAATRATGFPSSARPKHGVRHRP
ncbi:MAG TPA: zf-HC2 domain-containing protein, partial [Woeseiaceae bacterium]|nr:zf-HC2 domain-containing protein [Woeseiaceae bacterium]